MALAQNPDGRYGPDGKFAVWFSQQFNADGGWCCDLADGHEYTGDYSAQPDGSVILHGTSGDILIDAYKVLDGHSWDRGGTKAGGPNPTGHAVVWSNSPDLANAAIFCFSPGPLI